MGPAGPSSTFKTRRGIRQGCPASPILFAIFISFLERRLLRKFPEAGIRIGTDRLLCVSYADDISIMCSSLEELELVFTEVQATLA